MAVNRERKITIMEKFRRAKADTGSCEVQVALLTTRINELTDHFKVHKKDHHSRQGLIRLVEKRKRLLEYLEREDPARYKKLIGQLELRK